MISDMYDSEKYSIYCGDCVEVASGLPDECIDFSIFSPPFSSLYTYSNSDRDMGNSKDDAEFCAHFEFLIAELFRVIRPGRIVALPSPDSFA
mgnify:CR=1 FL=1